MHLATFLILLPFAASTAILPQTLFTNPSKSCHEAALNEIPTSYESAILARRILHLTPIGTLSTTFPSSHGSSTLENRPSGLDNIPIGLMDYIADCEDSGNPTILAINIATSFKNVAAGSNISLSLNWVPPNSASSLTYSAAALPRFALLGYLEKIPDEEVKGADLGKCFVKSHGDARYWLPGNRIHKSEWVRLVVTEVYWIGGFGDRAYIGWIPVEEWKGVKKEEWEGVRLPGEGEKSEGKGWWEWVVGGWRGDL